MSRSLKQLKHSFLASSVIGAFLVLVTCWIGILMYTVNPNIEPNTVWLHIINNYTSAGLRGVAIIGIIAMIMSTADSYINSSGVLVSNDIYASFNNIASQKGKLFITRIVSLVIGALSVFLALYSKDILDLLLIANNFYVPIVSVPLLFAILGFRSSSKSVLIGMLAGLLSVIFWRLYVMDYTNIDSIIPGVFFNMIFLFGSHYFFLQEGGWIAKKNSKNTNKISYFSILKNAVKEIAFFQKNLPLDKKMYIFFSIFLVITTISSIYSLKFIIRNQLEILIVMAAGGLFIATIFFIYSIWSENFKDKKLISIIWTLSLFIALVFKPGFEMVISNFSHFQSVIYLLSIFVLSILVSWQASFIFIILGSSLAVITYKVFYSYDVVPLLVDNNIDFKLIYLLIGVTGILFAFLKPKQEYQEATEAKVDTLKTEVSDLNETVIHYSERISDQGKEIERLGATAQRILNNVNHELRLPVGNVMNFAEMLNDGLGKLNENQLKMLSDEVYKNSNRLSSMIMNMLDLATLEAKKIELNKSTINFGELVHDRVQLCRKMYLENKNIDFKMSIEKDLLIKIDPNYMRQTVDNLVINAINFSTEGVIRISALRKGNFVEFVIEDDGIGIPREELYDIFTPFKMGSNTASKAEGRGVGLALCKAALEARAIA